MAGKTDRFVVSPQSLEELAFHNLSKGKRVPGSVMGFMNSSLVPEADMVLVVREVKEVPAIFEHHVEPHKHDVSELYAVIGDLTIEVMLDGERHEVKAPGCVFIPAGITHTMRYLEGNGYLLAVVRKGKYE